MHGSEEGGVVDAIQIETPEQILLDVEDTNITLHYARALARSILRFHSLHYKNSGQGIEATDLCSRPVNQFRTFYSCLFCSQQFPSQTIYCLRQHWKMYQFNKRGK